jgi:hypothetical protein
VDDVQILALSFTPTEVSFLEEAMQWGMIPDGSEAAD